MNRAEEMMALTGKNRKVNRRKKRRNTIAGLNRTVVFLAAFFVLIGMLTFVAAKYVKQTEKTSVANAREFYFTSDLLDGKIHNITALNNGTASATLTLMNHADELRYSEVDIDYTITVAETDGKSASGVTISTGTDSSSSGDSQTTGNASLTGTISAGEKQDASLTISGLQAGMIYQVTATTENTYSKTLTGTIIVNAIDNQVHATVADKGAYIETTLWTTESAASGLKLTYCAGLIPDNTDSKMSSAHTATENQTQTITFDTWGVNTSHVFRFFKSDTSKIYNVAINGTEVTVSATN